MKKIIIIIFVLIIYTFSFCSKPTGWDDFKRPQTPEKDSLLVYYKARANFYLEKGDENNVLIYADSILLYEPENIQVHNLKFQILTWEKNYPEALKLVQSLEQIKGEDYLIKFQTGFLSEKLNDTITAKAYYRKALDLLNYEIKSGNDDLNATIDKTTILTLLNKKDSATIILDSLLIKHPEYEEFILRFKNADRTELLDAY